MTSSGGSRRSDGGGSLAAPHTGTVAGVLVLLAAVAGWWCFRNGCILYYGDAESHLDISRSILDSRTPGYDQLGTVWLPVLHLICLPFAANNWLWSTGLAGMLPSALSFVAAGTLFYRAAREVFGSRASAAAALACFALNPNILYLASIPMTEMVFMALLFLVLFAVLRFGVTQHRRWLAVAVTASALLSLTRYDGWFLIPFIGVWLASLARRRKLLVLLGFGAAAALAPLSWIAFNWWQTGNALDFIDGPYSPAAIQNSQPYPGLHDWLAAVGYYSTAGLLCAGAGLVLLGLVGAVCAFRSRILIPLSFLLLTPLFYIWSMHSSGGTPIYVPGLWPHSYYNTRYGIAFVPLCAFAAGAIVLALPASSRKFWFLLPLIAIAPWLLHPSRQTWICWKESEVNSLDRRAWTQAAVKFLRPQYRPGQGILTSTGDVTGVYRLAGIPLAQTLNIGNGPQWFLATTRPDLYHPNAWLVMQAGDALSQRLGPAHSPYRPVFTITTSQWSPALTIAERRSRSN